MARNWTNGSGLALSAANLNALEADVTAALGVPDAALAGRVVAGATKTALDGVYAKTTDLATKEPLIPSGGIDEFLRGDKTWQALDVSHQTGADPTPREALVDPTNVFAPVGTLLNIPTHISNPGQVTHPSVCFVPEGWNGYKYWLAITPYPAGNDDHEDPNILASHDGITWVVPDGVTNPLADADGTPEYHSDTELKMGPNNTMYLFYRWYQGVIGGGQEEQLRFMSSTDGTTWTAPQNYYVQDETVRKLMSPTMIYEYGAWTMWAVDILPSPNKVVRLRSDTADPMSSWSPPVICSVGTMQSGKEPWHIYITRVGGRYYGLLNDCTLDTGGGSGELLFISSPDGFTFANSGVTVVPKVAAGKHDQLYRSCMIPSSEGGEFGFRVFYTGWLNSGPTWNLYYTFLSEGRWKNLTLQNAWVAYTGGGGYYQSGLRYRRKGKVVTLDGCVKSGALSTVIATLPADAIPASSCMWAVNSAGALGMIRVDGPQGAPGAITYFSGGAAPTYMPINIKFDIE